MTRHRHRAVRSLVRRLRPSPVRLAAAAATFDLAPLLALQAARRAR
jgi:hypothetical protein